MSVSNRLLKIAGMIKHGSSVADIGTDHAYLPVFLVKEGIAQKAFACDIGDGPLKNARDNIERFGIKNVFLRKGDGLSAVKPCEIDTAVIAGMGGDLIARIIDNAPWIKDAAYELILQPMTAAEELREYLLTNGFDIVLERAVSSQGRIYTVMKARFVGGSLKCSPLFLYIGRLSENMGEDELSYIKRKRRIIETLASDIGELPEQVERYEMLCGVVKEIDEILGKL